MKLHSLALAAATLVAMASAHADTFSAAGTISLSDAVFNRPFTLTSLSGVGTAVHYDTLSFSGVTPGSYDFRMVGVPAGSFDTFLLLYAGAFNPLAPLTNLVALNDDFGNIAAGSGFTFALSGGTSYTVVSTAFDNAGVGNYLTTVTAAVPEPATFALMALGMAGIGTLARRRRDA